MGFMDKVKAQAEQAVAKAQQAVDQGQSKVAEIQAKREADKLLTDLGKAVYAQRRSGGSEQAVDQVLQSLDAWAAEHGAVDTTPSTAGDDAAAPPPAAPPPPPMSSEAPPPPPPPAPPQG
jgi:hypothetical protein